MGALSAIILAPFLAAVALLVVPTASRGTVRMISLLGATVSLVLSVWVAMNYNLTHGGVQLREHLDLLPSFGIAWKMGVDGWGVALLLLTAIINVAGVFATWSLEERGKEFYAFLQLLVAGVFGVFVSLDLFIFFLFYEIAVLPMYLLIGAWGTSKKVPSKGPFASIMDTLDVGGREYAAMKLTLMLMGGSALILLGFLGMVKGAGGNSWDLELMQETVFSRELQLWAFPALWVGFGSLAGLFPFHTWSPDGHASAPTAVSMLHAGVLMKLGAFGLLRVGFICLPEGAEYWAGIVGTVAVVNIIWGAFSAAGQKDLKYIIAYSSVSHMGVVMLGMATMNAAGWNGAVFQMVAHGMMTGLFFALVGIVYSRAHTREIFTMGGFASKMPMTAVFFTIAGMSSLGLPVMAGFVAELLVTIGAWQSLHPWWAVPTIIGAFVTALYVLRAVRVIFLGEGPDSRFHDLTDAQGAERIALFMLGGSIIVLGLVPDLLLQYIDIATVEWLQTMGIQ